VSACDPARPPPQREGQLRYEIVAHSRWLSGMDIHPSRDIIATVAQDCTLAVWQLPIAMAKVRACCACSIMHPSGGLCTWQPPCPPIWMQAACLMSVCSLHDVLTGVAFCGEASDDVAAVAYDVEALLLWKGGSS
jgi:hypothetical protein